MSRRNAAKALGVSHETINKDIGGNKVANNGNKLATRALLSQSDQNDWRMPRINPGLIWTSRLSLIPSRSLRLQSCRTDLDLRGPGREIRDHRARSAMANPSGEPLEARARCAWDAERASATYQFTLWGKLLFRATAIWRLPDLLDFLAFADGQS